jgi:uncharacterized protein (TIGR03084 family)
MEDTVDVVAALVEQHAELDGLLSGLDGADWDRASRCEGWSVADVVLHLAQTDELATASLEGRFAEASGLGLSPGASAATVDEGADLLVARERGEPGAAVRERWRNGADTLVRMLRASDPHRRVQWVAGELSTRTLATTRLAEAWIHTGDIAVAFDIALAPTARLRHIAHLAWRTLPYAFARAGLEPAGPVAFELQGPTGDPWSFVPEDGDPATTIRGAAAELCLVAARRVDPGETGLTGEGPDAEAVLRLVRTYA